MSAIGVKGGSKMTGLRLSRLSKQASVEKRKQDSVLAVLRRKRRAFWNCRNNPKALRKRIARFYESLERAIAEIERLRSVGRCR